MEPIYRVHESEHGPRPTLQQMERHGRPEHYYALRFADVWAVSERAAKAIQRDYRATIRPRTH